MRLDMYFYIEITCGAATQTGLTFAPHPNTHTIVNTRRYGDLECFGLAHTPITITCCAGLFDLFATTVTGRTGLLYAEKALLHAYHPSTRTGATSLRAGTRLGACAFTGAAIVPSGYADLAIKTTGSLLEAYLEGIA